MTELKDYGYGVCVRKKSVHVENEEVTHIESLVEQSFEESYRFHRNDLGEIVYGVNQSHHKVFAKDIFSVPVRINKNLSTSFLRKMEKSTYADLLFYIEKYPDVLTSIWWKVTGHVAAYKTGSSLGPHSDNDVNYSPKNIPIDQTSVHHTVSSVTVINDEFEGGEIVFPYLDLEIKLEKGDVIFFPSNYIATHRIKEVTDGMRLSYVSWFGHGSPAPDRMLNIRDEPDLPQQGRYWLHELKNDFKNMLVSENKMLPEILKREKDHE